MGDGNVSAGYDSIVNVAAKGACSGIYVIPGDSAGSLLFQLLLGPDPLGCADRMPDGGPFLSAEQIATVEAWIDGGALE
jgi:hypothetical protein